MEISTSINILSLLVVTLIVVLVSHRARKIMGKFIDLVLFKTIPFLLKFCGAILLLWLIVSAIGWGWNKLHIIFPKMWSLPEIIGVVLVLCIFGFLAHLSETPRFKKAVFDKNNKIKNTLIKELYILIGIALAGVIIAVTPAISNSFALIQYNLGIGILIFGYPFYLFIRFIIWAVRTLRK